MTRFLGTIFVGLVFLGLPGRPQAASLKVAPARFIVHNVQPGKTYDIYKETGLRLTIFNDDQTTRSYVVSTHRPSERGRWETGYTEIPDAAWCWFEESEIAVGPQSRAYANPFLKIPDEEKYFNQQWIVTLGISGKPGPGAIALAVDIRAQIETKSKADVKGRPAGLLGLKPSMVRFEDIELGGRRESKVVLYNNDDKAHRYAITSLLDNRKIEQRTYLTHSYSAIPDSKWIERPKEIRIAAGDSAVLDLAVDIPKDPSHLGKKWEDIVLIRTDEGLARFVRVQIDTRKEAGAD
jgi:hypothetical protein